MTMLHILLALAVISTALTLFLVARTGLINKQLDFDSTRHLPYEHRSRKVVVFAWLATVALWLIWWFAPHFL